MPCKNCTVLFLRRENLHFDLRALRGDHTDPSRYISQPIGAREPEFGVVFEDPRNYGTIFKALLSDPDIQLLRIAPPQGYHLVSLAEDTIDHEGHPTAKVAALLLSRRRRASFFMDTWTIARSDISVKHAIKNTDRIELEQDAELSSNDDSIVDLLLPHVPGADVLRGQRYSVSAVCITARASFDIAHVMEDSGIVVVYECCNDACVITDPFCEAPRGYRAETELEVKKVLTRKDAPPLCPTLLNQIIDDSLDYMKNIIQNKAILHGPVCSADISKVLQANIQVGDAMCQPSGGPILLQEKINNLLAFNIHSGTFEHDHMKNRIARMVNTHLPRTELMSALVGEDGSAAIEKMRKGFFPGRERVPFFPACGSGMVLQAA